MKKLIIIPLAALGILVGLGLVAAQDDHVPAGGQFERPCADTETGERVTCHPALEGVP